MKLASFDIFDTTLIRKCGVPENIFYLLAKRLYPDNPAKCDDFFLWRCNAERQAIKTKGNQNVTLAEIYDGKDIQGFNEYQVKQFVALEKCIEGENLIANPAIRQIIEDKRTSGYQICFISDMYLDSNFLSEKLKKEGCLKEGERVFVSCEAKARKSDGKLFAQVRDELNPEKWVHYGDNKYSDVNIPKKHGIETVLVDTSFTGVERRMLAKAKEFRQRNEMSVWVGYSRASRIKGNNDSFTVIAADYVAPAYIPYVKFVLEQAKKNDVKQLYFLSRDSYILLKTAQKMNAEYADIDLKYLFVSRKSLMLPYLVNMDKEDFLDALDKKTVMRKNVSSLLALLGVEDKMLEEHNISFSYKKIISKEQEADFLNKIFETSLTSVLKQMSVEKHALLMEYFAQEGLLNGKKSAMVDVGWLGTSRLMINSILRREGYEDVLFYYLGIRGDVLHTQYGNYVTYFHSGQLTTEATALIENYFSASPYPTTVGYRKEANGLITPLFPDGKQYEETEIIKANISTIEWLSEALSQINADETLLFVWSSLALDSISSLKDKINLTVFLSSDDFDATSFVRRLSLKELFVLVCTGKPITAFDKASLQLTTGLSLLPLLWRMRTWTGRVRRYLFLKYVR